MWFGPTVALGSGGADVTTKLPFGPLKPWPTPSKPTPTGGGASRPGVVCTTGSGTELCAGTGNPFLGSFSFFLSSGGGAAGVRSRSGGETS
jgi:hypothetical protein